MTRLAILWHMHQPFYVDLATGEHILPWVRLHALKDYLGMPALLRDFPGVRVTFNLVPSLLVQIQAFAQGGAQDRLLEIGLKPADALEPAERAFLVANGFHAPFERMIKPYPRYTELQQRRLDADSFTTDDLRDLQVLHKLVWIDPDWLAHDARLVKLRGKQAHYTEQDKQELRQVELEILNAVIPEYRALADEGRIELSTSPFYHPILPLLCDSDVHLRAHPQSSLPRHLFARPTDAADQLVRAMAFHKTLFGTDARGVWPSEGSLSDEVIGLLAERKTHWTATDETLLARTLNVPLTADDLYRPYEIGTERTVRCVFRDHGLSDLIGFAYQAWEAEAAANDFVARVREAGRRFDARHPSSVSDGEVATVSVILDGENAWEHYPGGGRPFLRALYGMLQASSDIQMVTMSEAVSGPARRLRSIFPGSWINGDFYIWAGHGDDHRAWGQLAAARATFDERASLVAPDRRKEAWEELLIAEGSDWFWWYGDDHSSDHDRAFDDLFRRHLRNVYRSLGKLPPDALFATNITTTPVVTGPVRTPILATPTVSGSGSRFDTWAGATHVPLSIGGGSMHRVAGRLVHGLWVTLDRTAMYFRLEGPELAERLLSGELALAVLIDRPVQPRLDMGQAGTADAYWVAARTVDLTVPFRLAGVQAGDGIRLSLLVTDSSGHVLEQHPGEELLELEIPTRHLDAVNWQV